ncbi:MAG: dipeptidyl aminopeptidase/acylaminoacyl peptidase, partial [Limisphaerales bacterium]
MATPNSKPNTTPSANHREIPVHDFFRNPDQTRFTISPDGSQLAWLAPWKSRLNIHVTSIAQLSNGQFDGKNEALRVTSSEARDITIYIWKNKDCILYLQDFGGDENFHLFKVDVHTGAVADLTPFDGVKVDLVDYRYDEPDQVFIQMNKRNPELFDIYKLKISTGELALLEENPGNISSWIADHNGEIRAAITTDGTNTSLLYRAEVDQDFKTVLTTNFRDSVEPQFFTFDNKALVALSNRGRNTSSAVILNLESGEETLLYENPEYDCMGVGYSRLRKKIISVLYVDWKLQRHIKDEQTANWLEKLNDHLNDFHFKIESITDDENIVIVRARSDVQPGAYYLYSIAEDQLTFLTNVQSAHKPEELSKTQAIEFKSRDGLKIHGYLTLPAHCEAKNLPVVVNPHGGPWYRDTWDFNPEGLFLANQGIAVLRINFRGSTGYGKAFWEASFGQWGLKMQDDITDGVKWLID